MRKSCAGLHIDGDLIKVAIVKLDDQGIPVVTDAETFESIEDARGMMNKASEIVTMLPENKVINATAAGAKKIKDKIVNSEIDRICSDYGVSIEYFDTCDIREFKKTVNNTVVETVNTCIKAVRSGNQVEELKEQLASIDVEVNLIDSESFSLYNLFSCLTENITINENMALIDINSQRLLIVLLTKENEYFYTRYIPIVENDIGEAILNLTNTFISEEIVEQYGVINRAMISGNSMLSDVLQNELSQALNSEDSGLFRALPLDIENKRNIVVEIHDSDEYAISIGLALRGVTNTITSFNYLNNQIAATVRNRYIHITAITLLAIIWFINFAVAGIMIPEKNRVKDRTALKLTETRQIIAKCKTQKQITTYLKEFSVVKAMDEVSEIEHFPLNIDVLDQISEKWSGQVKQLKITGNKINIKTIDGKSVNLTVVACE